MKHNTLNHSYLDTIIQHVLIELHWFILKIVKIVRTIKKKEQLSTSLLKTSTVSYQQEYLLTSLQDRILR